MTGPPLALPPLGLYIHIPWCLKKCPYCDFNSHAFEGELPEARYIDNLLRDLTSDTAYIQDRPLESIFIGGGTPSLFSPAGLHRLLEEAAKIVPFAGDIEITLEANPGTFEMEKFRDFRGAGINRLSIGIQSFDAGMLHRLGRVHDDTEARKAADSARDAGFDNFNLDLMFALPGQTVAGALEDLDTALEFEPPHLSWYQLTIEPNTVFFSKPPRLPDDDLAGEIQDKGMVRLREGGLDRYEISAYSRPGLQSRHNLNYWRFGDYLGIGAGAHGKITLAEENRILRTRKIRQPRGYLESTVNFTAEVKEVSARELPLEFMMNVLRLCAGEEESLFETRTGLPLAAVRDHLDHLRDREMMQEDRLAATDKGLLFLNDVLEEFLPAQI